MRVLASKLLNFINTMLSKSKPLLMFLPRYPVIIGVCAGVGLLLAAVGLPKEKSKEE